MILIFILLSLNRSRWMVPKVNKQYIVILKDLRWKKRASERSWTSATKYWKRQRYKIQRRRSEWFGDNWKQIIEERNNYDIDVVCRHIHMIYCNHIWFIKKRLRKKSKFIIKSFTNRENRSGSRTDPCGTSEQTGKARTWQPHSLQSESEMIITNPIWKITWVCWKVSRG